jgi:hypothetical protein
MKEFWHVTIEGWGPSDEAEPDAGWSITLRIRDDHGNEKVVESTVTTASLIEFTGIDEPDQVFLERYAEAVSRYLQYVFASLSFVPARVDVSAAAVLVNLGAL